jgi:hypothetical protein
MRHAQVRLGEIPLCLKMRKAHSPDVTELETHGTSASASLRIAGAKRDFGIRHDGQARHERAWKGCSSGGFVTLAV